MMKNKVMLMSGVAAVMMLAMGASSAMAADSSTWEGSYEADVLPGSAGWSPGLDAGSITAGILSFSGTDTANASKFDIPNMSTNTNGGFSWEFRLNMNAGGFFMHMFGTTPDATPYHWQTMEISTTSAGVGDSGGLDAGAVSTAITPGWHTYRVTGSDATGNWVLYLDNNPTPVATRPIVGGWAGPVALDGFQFGVNGSGDFDFDYLRWTDEGALPAPEPATMALLGLGSLAMLRRRRNR